MAQLVSARSKHIERAILVSDYLFQLTGELLIREKLKVVCMRDLLR